MLLILKPQSRSGDKLIKFQVFCPPNGTAVLRDVFWRKPALKFTPGVCVISSLVFMPLYPFCAVRVCTRYSVSTSVGLNGNRITASRPQTMYPLLSCPPSVIYRTPGVPAASCKQQHHFFVCVLSSNLVSSSWTYVNGIPAAVRVQHHRNLIVIGFISSMAPSPRHSPSSL